MNIEKLKIELSTIVKDARPSTNISVVESVVTLLQENNFDAAANALHCGFYWDVQNGGYDYWNSIYDELITLGDEEYARTH